MEKTISQSRRHSAKREMGIGVCCSGGYAGLPPFHVNEIDRSSSVGAQVRILGPKVTMAESR